jgi:serine/threonine protein kinase
MELCVASLDKLFKNEKGYNGPQLEGMPPPEDVFLQLAKGMSYIHKLNLSHRDIKPHNVLIYVKQERSNKTSNNVDVILKWTDFGGSKKVNMEGENSMSGFKFSFNWCSPEVLKPLFDDTTDASKFSQKMIKSDIFSEGLVFGCYLLEGKHLYGSSNDEIQRNLIANNPINMPTIGRPI